MLFGTGKYLGTDDVSDRQIQSFYGIWDLGDDGQAPVMRTQLLQQRFVETDILYQDANGSEVSRGRSSTNEQVDWSTQQGWYIDFDIERDPDGINRGERVVLEPVVQGGRVIFVSLVPSNNPCAGGGYSWINALDLRTGSRLALSPFDTNRDGVIGGSDLLATTRQGQIPGTSLRLSPNGQDTGVYSAPASFGDGAGRVTTVVSTAAGGLALINAFNVQQWRVWQQVR